MTTPYPLAWPTTIPRWSGERQTGAFKTSLSTAMNNVETSLRLFGKDSGKPVSDVVISSNVTLGQQRPSDPGVAKAPKQSKATAPLSPKFDGDILARRQS